MNFFSKKSSSSTDRDPLDPRRSDASLQGGRRKGEIENPYLAARRTWNDHIGSVIAQRNAWQVLTILSLLIVLSCVGGIIYIGSQSKLIPYVIEVDKLGQAMAAGPVQVAGKADQRIVHAMVAEFVSDARLVTPDVALQRKSIFRVYSKLSPKDPATEKMNEWFNATEEKSPFKRAEKELVNTDIKSVLPQTPDTWQVDWTETIRNREGVVEDIVNMRALITVYQLEVTSKTTEEQLRNNPMSIYVRDFFWSRLK